MQYAITTLATWDVHNLYYVLIVSMHHPWLPGGVKGGEVEKDVSLIDGETAADLFRETRVRSRPEKEPLTIFGEILNRKGISLDITAATPNNSHTQMYASILSHTHTHTQHTC